MRRSDLAAVSTGALLFAGCGLVLDLAPPTEDRDAAVVAPRDAGPATDGGDAGPVARDAAVTDAGEACSEPAAPWTAACGGPTAVVDDFTDGLDLELWGRSIGVDPLLVSGPDGLTLPSAENAAATLGSSFAVDLRGDWVSTEVIQPAEGEGAATFLGLRFEHQNRSVVIRATLRDGQLHFTVRMNGAAAFLESVPYDPTPDRWWRIREGEGSLYFETSPDGACWRTRSRTAAPPFLAHVWVELGVGPTRVGVPLTSPAVFAGVDHDPLRRSEPWCEVSAFEDDFTDGAIDPSWLVVGDTCSVVEAAGHLVMTPAHGSNCDVRTRTAYDLLGRTATLRFAPGASVLESGLVYAKLQDGGGDFVTLRFDGSSLYVVTPAGGTIAAGFSGWPAEVRFTADGTGSLSVRAVSTDGTSYQFDPVLADGVDLRGVSVGAGLDARGGMTGVTLSLAFERYQ